MQNYGYTAYPYGQTYGYSPYGQRFAPQQQQMTQPMQAQAQPQMQPQVQYEIPIQDVRFVTSEEAKAYIVMPNSKALLIDKSGMAYLKSADSMGQSQTQYFRFEAVNADGTPIKPQEPTPQVDLKDFVKLDDMNKFGFATVEDFKKLCEKFEEFKRSFQMAQVKPRTEAQK